MIIYTMDYFNTKNMIYTNRSINLISFIITIIIYLILYLVCFDKFENIIQKISSIISNFEYKEEPKEVVNNKDVDLGDWCIEIPSIKLKAPIAEGTESSTLNTKVGHFKSTPIEHGNIGLAAYNDGYEFNYFKNLKKVKKDDKIIYTHGTYKREYVVYNIAIIKYDDWTYLEETLDDMITLITGVENESQYRRCVQAVETEI